ncbi:MAG: Gfo/Idh/MocA family oxidoreductase [Candidatus Caenarcaniphilales bacterium]|nr:Gfo/Idh/MocA family oxidoreductase [Candidatus Caenarcaniphilales bacterium]
MKIAVIGAGSWGKNLVRNFYELGVLKVVCDLNAENLERASDNHSKLHTTSSMDEIINDKEIDGIVVATPAHTHYEIAKRSLLAGHNVYVEKPLAQNVEEAEELHKIAQDKDLVLMVGHLLLYHPAVNKLKNLIASGELGTIQYINSDRRNFNANHRSHSNVMWDLAPHDFSMMAYILNAEPEKIVNVRTWASSGDSIDVAHIDMIFPNNIGGHIHNSWLDPQKQALLTVNGSKKTAVLNDTFKENKLEIYSRRGDGGLTVEKPVYSNDEPLRLECKHFLSCIKNKQTPTSDSINGYQVVKYVEACQNFISNDATATDLEPNYV